MSEINLRELTIAIMSELRSSECDGRQDRGPDFAGRRGVLSVRHRSAFLGFCDPL